MGPLQGLRSFDVNGIRIADAGFGRCRVSISSGLLLFERPQNGGKRGNIDEGQM